MTPDPRERYVGCLLGNAVGDALGSPMEWLAVDRIKCIAARDSLDAYVDEARRVVGMAPGHLFYPDADALFRQNARKAGQTTDDNLLTMILAETIATRGSLDMDAFSERLSDLACFDDIGSTTKRAIKALNRYASIPGAWKVAGREVSKRSLCDRDWPQGAIASNGALMRIAPVGLYHAHSGSDAISRDAILSTIITHDSDICAWSSACMAHVIANLARGMPKERCVELAAEEVRQDGTVIRIFDDPYEARLWHRHRGEQIHHSVSRSHVTVKGYDLVARAAYDCLRGLYGAHDLPIGDVGSRKDFYYVLHSLRIATHHFLHTDSFEEALIACVNHGGDTDTNAAICGAMAGAYYGVDAIPKQWLDALNAGAPTDGMPKLYYSVHEIEGLADGLFIAADARRPRQTIMVR